MADTTNETLNSANEAAGRVLKEAMKAAAQGTFAVGGCLVNNHTGEVIHALHNQVMRPLASSGQLFTFDPTAHGERQLVYWYYANKDSLGLPEPENLTIVTNLDPCVMCTGTLLTAGFNVATVAIDPLAGINYDQTFRFTSLPQCWVSQAQSRFGYYACSESDPTLASYARPYSGGDHVAFNTSAVSAERLMACSSVFEASVTQVRTRSSDSGRPPEQLVDPAELPAEDLIKVRFKAIDPHAFELRLPHPRQPNQALHDHLVHVMRSQPGARNAVALVDPFGNVILSLPDHFEESPVHTAFMNVTRAYAQVRFKLMDDPQTHQQAEQTLTHPKYGTVVFLYAPDPDDSTTVMTLGAYGSTLEGAIPQTFPANLQYFHPPQNGTTAALVDLITRLPPFYTQMAQVAIAPVAAD